MSIQLSGGRSDGGSISSLGCTLLYQYGLSAIHVIAIGARSQGHHSASSRPNVDDDDRRLDRGMLTYIIPFLDYP